MTASKLPEDTAVRVVLLSKVVFYTEEKSNQKSLVGIKHICCLSNSLLFIALRS